MATVIDTLIVELGLDPKKFTTGQREAMSETRRALEEGKRGGKDIERQADAINNTLSKLKGQALSFFSLLAGGGIIALVARTTAADASVSRLSRTLGEAVPEIATWQAAVKGAGGSAESVAEHMTSLVSAFQRFESFHEPISFQPAIAALDAESKRLGGVGVSLTDAAGKMKPIGEFYKELAFVFQKMVQMGPAMAAKAGEFARALSIPEGLFDLLRRGTEETTRRLEEARKIGVVTKAEAEEAEKMAKSWANMEQAVISMGRNLLHALLPMKVLDSITKHASDSNLRLQILQLGRMRDEMEAMPKGSPQRAALEKEIKQKEDGVEEQLRARRGETPPTPQPAPQQLSPGDKDLLVRTVIGEAKGQPEQGQAAVAHVVMNRLQSGRFGGSMEKVLFAPRQFEPWETRRGELMNISPESADYRRVSALVDRVLAGQLADPTKGATHFANEAVVADRGNAGALSWIEQMKRNGSAVQIGAHTFGRPDAAAVRWPEPPAAAAKPELPAASQLPPGPLGARPGAPSAAIASSVQNDNRATTSTTTTEIRVENLNVHTQATDGAGIAGDIKAALEQRSRTASLAIQANSGPA
jgi:spore germination cell wall hydrolase CwlJ-like protein